MEIVFCLHCALLAKKEENPQNLAKTRHQLHDNNKIAKSSLSTAFLICANGSESSFTLHFFHPSHLFFLSLGTDAGPLNVCVFFVPHFLASFAWERESERLFYCLKDTDKHLAWIPGPEVPMGHRRGRSICMILMIMMTKPTPRVAERSSLLGPILLGFEGSEV